MVSPHSDGDVFPEEGRPRHGNVSLRVQLAVGSGVVRQEHPDDPQTAGGVDELGEGLDDQVGILAARIGPVVCLKPNSVYATVHSTHDLLSSVRGSGTRSLT